MCACVHVVLQSDSNCHGFFGVSLRLCSAPWFPISLVFFFGQATNPWAVLSSPAWTGRGSRSGAFIGFAMNARIFKGLSKDVGHLITLLTSRFRMMFSWSRLTRDFHRHSIHNNDPRKFRSETSDNMDRRKAQPGRSRARKKLGRGES